jgi:hypothetical protein
MTREVLRELEAGAMDALRAYVMLIVTPFDLAKRLVTRARRASKRSD